MKDIKFNSIQELMQYVDEEARRRTEEKPNELNI
jgi:hypothetical protein